MRVCAPNVSCLVLWPISIVVAFRRNRHLRVYWLEFIGCTQGSQFILLYVDMKFVDPKCCSLAYGDTVG